MGDDPGGVEVDDVARLWARVSETDGLERAAVLDELGGVLLEVDREAEAVAVVEAARQVYVDADEPAEVARCDRNLGLLLMSLDCNDESFSHYVDACAVYDALLLSADAAGCRQAMAELTAGAGQHREALELFERAAGAFAEAGDAVRAGWCRFDASSIMLELGEVDAAAANLDDARRLFREERAYLFVARVDSLRAEVARRRGGFDEALRLLAASRAVFESSGSDGEVDRCDDSRAEVLIDAGRVAEAVDRLEASRDDRRSAGNAVGVAWCDLHLSRAYESLGRGDDADASRKAARAVFDAAGFDDVLERPELAPL
jgi:tetratricopeptide (TPR) repeat protein